MHTKTSIIVLGQVSFVRIQFVTFYNATEGPLTLLVSKMKFISTMKTHTYRYLHKMYLFFFILYGIHFTAPIDRTSPVLPMKRQSTAVHLAKIIRYINIIPLILFAMDRVRKIYSTFPVDASFVDIISALHHVLAISILFVARMSIHNKQKVLMRLLPPMYRTDTDHRLYMRLFLIIFILNMPYFITDCKFFVEAFQSGKSLFATIGSGCAVYTWQVQMAAWTVYLQSAARICEKLRTIDEITASGALRKRIDFIVNLKAEVRWDISSLNSRFGTFVFMLYLKIFTLITYNINKIVTHDGNNRLSMSLYIIGSIMQGMVTFLACHIGSELIALASRTHRRLFDDALQIQSSLMPNAWDRTRTNMSDLRDILAYREEWDSLRISDCFVNRKSTMFTYIGTLVSSIAIILQFDYRILYVLDKSRILARSA